MVSASRPIDDVGLPTAVACTKSTVASVTRADWFHLLEGTAGLHGGLAVSSLKRASFGRCDRVSMAVMGH